MAQHSRQSVTTDLFHWTDDSEIPLEWGDLPEISLDPEIDTNYWGWRDDTDTDPLDSDDQPEGYRSGSAHCVQEEKCHVEDMSSKLRVAETKIEELQEQLKKALERNRDIVKEKEQLDAVHAALQSKLEGMHKEHEGLKEKLEESVTRNTHMLVQQKQQNEKSRELEIKLQEMEGENLKLQEMLDKALGKKATILKEKKDLKIKHIQVKAKLEDAEKRHRVVLANLQDVTKQNKSLRGFLQNAQKSNADGLREREARHREMLHQMEKKHNNMQCKLHEMEEENRELMEKNKKLQQNKEDLEKLCAATMCPGIEALMSQNAQLEELYENAQYKLAKLHEEKRQQPTMHKDIRCTLQQLFSQCQDMQEAHEIQLKRYKDLEVKQMAKKDKMKELERRFEELEGVSELHNIILHNIILQLKQTSPLLPPPLIHLLDLDLSSVPFFPPAILSIPFFSLP